MWMIKTSKAGAKARRSFSGNLAMYALVGALALLSALPLIYTFINSIKPVDELYQFPPKFTVARPTLDNYSELYQLASTIWVPLSRYMFNTLFVATAGTLLHALFATMAAYPLAKHRFPGKNVVFSAIVLGLMFVPAVTFMPLFVIMSETKLLNTYGALIFPGIGVSLGLFLMKQFIEQLPDPILEAARIDGANETRILFRIIIPNATPAIMTVILFQFTQMWNFTQTDLIFSESLKTLRAALEQIVPKGDPILRAGAGSAASVILMLPPIALFILIQRKVVETMTFAGIK
ncbi:carbohydrate ABC transporter permease [Cohnella sp.]|uniref:carbohydrate ABC transporter permease n=1 Tax=Cohnella sp. TaxID=1883426 RepID=UPI00356AAFF5